MKTEFVLVTFDIDSKTAPKGSYLKAYKLLDSFGMKTYRANQIALVELPTTTVMGHVEMGDAATPESIRSQLMALFAKAGIPLTHILVGFLRDVAGYGTVVSPEPPLEALIG